MNLRSLICGFATAGIVATGLAAATTPASAVSASLLYDCTWNSATQSGVASAVVDTDIPAALVIGQQAPVTVTITVTLPALLSDGLRAVAAAYEGNGVVDSYVNGAIRQATITIPRAPVGAPGTPIAMVGSGPLGPTGSPVPTTLELTAGKFTAHIQGIDSNGNPIGLAVTDLTCDLQAGQNPHVDTATVTGLPTTTTLTVQNTPLQYGDQAGVTANVTQPGSNVKPAGTVQFTVDGKSVQAKVKGGKAKATLPPSLKMGVRTVTAVFTPTDPNLATSQVEKTFKVVKADSISSMWAVYRPAKDKIVARGKVESAYGTSVDGDVKYVLKRNGVKIRTKTVALNKFDVARASFAGIAKSGRYAVIARYLGSDTLKRSVDRFKFEI